MAKIDTPMGPILDDECLHCILAPMAHALMKQYPQKQVGQMVAELIQFAAEFAAVHGYIKSESDLQEAADALSEKFRRCAREALHEVRPH